MCMVKALDLAPSSPGSLLGGALVSYAWENHGLREMLQLTELYSESSGKWVLPMTIGA